MTKIAFVGESKLGCLLKNFDIEVFVAGDSNEVYQKVNELLKEDYSIILITEDLATTLQDLLLKRVKPLPVVFILPSFVYSGVGEEMLGETIEKAIGIDIFSKRKS